jgi:hypothetical protein
MKISVLQDVKKIKKKVYKSTYFFFPFNKETNKDGDSVIYFIDKRTKVAVASGGIKISWLS